MWFSCDDSSKQVKLVSNVTVPRVPPLNQIWWTKAYNLGNIALAKIISFYINFPKSRNLRIMITSIPVKFVK